MVDNLDQTKLAMDAAILRQIWMKKNMVVFENKFESPKSVVEKAKIMLETNQLAQLPACLSSISLATQATRSQTRQSRIWQPPATNQFKCNWDVAMNSSGNTIGIGMILRDYKGNILASACCNKPCQYKPAIIESIALRTTMLIC